MTVTKLEHGHRYPAAAFAYAGDNVPVENWKLRLWEHGKGLDAETVIEAARNLPNSGLSKDARLQARAKIRSALVKCGVPVERWPETIPGTVNASVTESAVLEGCDTGKTAEVVVIRPGFNSSRKRFYTKEALESAIPMFDGVKMYIDHQTDKEDAERPEGSLLRLGGVLRNVRMRESDGAIVGTAHIVHDGLRQMLVNLSESNLLGTIGVSINAIAAMSRRTIDGVHTFVVESIRKVRSVDFVTEPGAGGEVLVCESADALEALDRETLEALRPDLVEQIAGQPYEETDTMDELAQVKSELESLRASYDSLRAENTALAAERDAYKAKIEEFAAKALEQEKAAKVAEAAAQIQKILAESKLPDAAKTRISKRFENAESVDGVKEAVEEEREYLKSAGIPGVVKECGGTVPANSPDNSGQKSIESLKESFVASFMSRGKPRDEAIRLAEIAARGHR
ncbi:MAG TPA: hypothetical protein P5540_19445 [Candidatus Hydrogenedentes bacterium]|nr:hypothetical protein [Candidatus Hydrogenedentota bacterium]